MTTTRLAGCALTLLCLITTACGSDETAPAGAKGTENQDAGGPPAKKFEELMGYDWSVDGGVEAYWCVFQTLKDDLWVNDYRPISPPGTHHVTLGFGDPGVADGVYNEGDDIGGPFPCNGVTLGQNLAFGGLVGTDEFEMPPGVAVKIPKGKQMLLSVHVSNTGTDKLSGRSGIEVVHADPAKVDNLAEIVFIDDVNLNVTPGKSTQQASCALDGDSTIFAILHHMHRTGVHMKTTALPASGSPQVLFDSDYTFTEQKFVPVAPSVQLTKGDPLQVTCDYENPSSDTLTFGESTDKNEMCIAAVYRYPALGINFNCIATQ